MGVIQGVIHGKTIELTTDPGLPDGVTVEVVVRQTKSTEEWGEGLRRSAGSLADEPQETFDALDRIIAERKNMKYREFGE